MKSILKKIAVLSILVLPISANAEDEFSFGLGLGTSYSGLGANLSLRSESDMKSFSAGCISYSSVTGSTCGVGLSWIKTDLFGSSTNKHGLGGYIGVVGTESTLSGDKAAYGIGAGYYYFFNGIDRSGTNIGLSFVTDGGDVGSSVILQVGYQF